MGQMIRFSNGVNFGVPDGVGYHVYAEPVVTKRGQVFTLAHGVSLTIGLSQSNVIQACPRSLSDCIRAEPGAGLHS